MSPHWTGQIQVCVCVRVRTVLLASGQKTQPTGRDDLHLLTSLSSGRKSCSERKHHLSSSMVVISLCSVLRARILKPVIHLNTVMDVMKACSVLIRAQWLSGLLVTCTVQQSTAQDSLSVCDYHYELELTPYLVFARLCLCSQLLISIFDKRETLRRQPLRTETGWAELWEPIPSHPSTSTTYTPDTNTALTTKHLLSHSQTMTQFWRCHNTVIIKVTFSTSSILFIVSLHCGILLTKVEVVGLAKSSLASLMKSGTVMTPGMMWCCVTT